MVTLTSQPTYNLVLGKSTSTARLQATALQDVVAYSSAGNGLEQNHDLGVWHGWQRQCRLCLSNHAFRELGV